MSDWNNTVQMREKTLAPVRRVCLDCRADVDPVLTPSGAKVYLPRCQKCITKRKERDHAEES